MRVRGVVETCLYVEDLAPSRAFWSDLLGLGILFEDDRMCALDAGNRSVVLLFRRGGSTEPIMLSGGLIPPHDGSGKNHVGLAIDGGEFELWRERLSSAGIAIESVVAWPRGGRSIYFRDPDGHLVELLTPGVWAVY
jgi:catechol 2,3-dioxygenase-like lactoylglutathione lyase family enzyme